MCSAFWKAWPQWFHHHGGLVCLAIGKGATGEMSSADVTLSHFGPHPALFLLLLIASAKVLRDAVQNPAKKFVLEAWKRRRKEQSLRQVKLSERSSSTTLDAANSPAYSPFSSHPSWCRAEPPSTESAVRLFLYYGGMVIFFVGYWKLSVPIFHLARVRRNPILCLFPRFATICESAKPIVNMHDAPRSVDRFFSVFKWATFFSLPGMLLNILGHVIFPRALWKPIPSVTAMLSNSVSKKRSDEELKASDFEKSSLHSDISFVSQSSLESMTLFEPHFVRPYRESVESDTSITSETDSSEDRRMRAVSQLYDMDFVLYVRYVTRGTNPHLMAANVAHSARVLQDSGFSSPSYIIEVVTDHSLPTVLDKYYECKVRTIVVPESYEPPNGAKFKARALSYAIQESFARDYDWIVHLDEETVFDVDAVTAVMHHCGRENYVSRISRTQPFPRIGQGPIVYGRQMELRLCQEVNALVKHDTEEGRDPSTRTQSGNWITTLADSYRVADDCGRFRFQYECGEAWVGMHGSFVVVANIVEKLVTFDHGEDGSIAEDAYFAMLARSQNVRFRWIDSLMYEQSPFTYRDFVKQRSRWLVGGLKVCFSPKIPWKQRLIMGVPTMLWAFMPFGYTAMAIVIIFGSGNPANNYLYYNVLLPGTAAVSSWCYALGFAVTYRLKRLGFVRYFVLLYIQMMLTPLFGAMEVSAVCYALWNFASLSVGFHVVQKEDCPANDDNA
eukprot:Plantae.Rhodophyta-Hildenbrandia_rubra.ctg12165.p1 GENE.Plantae.Rhodophyta-Hildenbrandia_rubra.ctg12165~~Plantae.Rhodophyta-Hildenbrandia_rubra.ctg12165.p1  ORF type:complete len:837 (-),score=87.56 Plantae.Rhodophyta-Hildenbrandia_rubra.ctg12165:370-2556(-)